MITKKNYFDHIKRIGFENVPEELKKAHLVIMTKTDNGRDWSTYEKEKEFKNMVDLVFKKLQEFIVAKNKGKGLDGVSQENKARFIEEFKIIKRFLSLHGKKKSKEEILSFIDALQNSIRSKKIRKTSFFSNEIMLIQEKMVQMYNRMHNYKEVRLREETIEKMEKAMRIIEEKNQGKEVNAEVKNIPLSGIPAESPVMCSTEFADMKFDSIGFEGKWRELIGDPCKGFTAMIYGKPKMGKSYLAVDFAGYLARNHGKVLYVAREEKLDATLQKKINDKNVTHVNLFVTDSLPEDLTPYNFIFLDSVNKLGLAPKALEELKSKYPGKCFIYVFQTTKMGAFRGKNEFQHDVDVVIEIPEKGKAIQFGRFNQGGEINIFDEPNEESNLEGLDGNKKGQSEDTIEIETEFPIPLEELAFEILSKGENPSKINNILHHHPKKANDAVTKMLKKLIKAEKWNVEIRNVKFDYNDSGNLSHGVSYFKIYLKGKEKALRKICGSDKTFIYEWDKSNLDGKKEERKSFARETLNNNYFKNLLLKNSNGQ